MDRKVGRQLEKLMDETTGRCADVIVQFKSEKSTTLEQLLEAAVDTERSRSLMVDPMNMLPPPRKEMEKAKPTRRILRQQNASLSAQVALRSFAAAALTDTSGLISGFLSSQIVSAAVAEVRKYKTREQEARPSRLNNIAGARIMVRRSDLPGIVGEHIDAVEGVYENAAIKAPRVSPAQEDTLGREGEYLGATWGLERTKALSTWSAFGTRGKRANGDPVRVAVLDTRIDATHPDLVGKVADFAEFDTTGNINQQGVANARDSGRHGTHVAGTIVGGNASGGWIGMAPDAELIAGLVLDGDKGGTLAQVIAGIDWSVTSGASVINMSLGGLTFDPSVDTPYQRALVDALVNGVLVVAAIGNDGHQTTGAPGNDYFSLAVGAHDIHSRCAGFSAGRTHILQQSNFINDDFLPLVYTKPDVSAPGVAVKSSVPGGTYERFNGTSMATPHVAGAAALLLAAVDFSGLQPLKQALTAKDFLLGGVADLGEAGQDQRFGYGAINVLKSIDEARKRDF
ncbi:S8 family serine peptidase [Marimonas arenosa]|uniref:S8 family serine peptidase n=1 Tax=Marimonas arenosa TaxID=1795305 RepID=A0AAE3WF49_9RHOB|nr:S8 family serine peptidase [Marimonas arenosa]MDQ2091484.1 S8 family serine peptidase [Marimonas arenosa]